MKIKEQTRKLTASYSKYSCEVADKKTEKIKKQLSYLKLSQKNN